MQRTGSGSPGHEAGASGVLQGRVAVVTGASRGIGRAIALALASAGADIVVGYLERSAEALTAAAEIDALGPRGIPVRVDVRERSSVRAMIASARESLGGVDILVNNAGVLQQKPFSEITDTDWDQVLSVNLKGAFICSQEVLEAMTKRGAGRIINIASSGGQLGGPLAAHYSASKAGVISLTRSLARILAPDIAVNCVSPGLIKTEMAQAEISSGDGAEKLRQVPAARLGTPDEVADAVLFLASSAPYITGHTLNVNGGLYLG